MNSQSVHNAPSKRPVPQILFFSLLIALPGVFGAFLGLIYVIIPVVVLVYLYKWEQGVRYVLAGLLIGSALSALSGSIGSLLFTATFIAPGYALARSALQGDSPLISGIKGVSALSLCWLVLLLGYLLTTGSNPVVDYINALDQLLDQELQTQQLPDTIEPNTLTILAEIITQIKVFMPKIFPALLVVFALSTVWVTMLAGNKAVPRFTGYQPWSDHKIWQLPPQLGWLFGASILVFLLPTEMPRLVAINVIIVVSFVYMYQGFSIVSFFLHKWNCPLFLRIFFYAMVLLQSFGTLLLFILGVVDTWFDLRRLNTNATRSS